MGSCHSSAKVRKRDIADEDCAVEKLELDGAFPATSAPAAAVGTGLANSEVSAASTTASFSASLYPKTSNQRWWKKKSSKDYGVRVGSDKVHELEVPGRICTNGASKIACLYTQQGKKGINQDAMIVLENFSSRRDTVFCGVFDGHGPYGHMVSRKVRDALPEILSTQWASKLNDDQSSVCKMKNSRSTNSEDSIALDVDDETYRSMEGEGNEKLPEMHLPLKLSILKSFKLMDKELKFHPKIDCFCSGSTAVALIKQGRELVIGNVGDSRAVLATRDEDNSLIAIQLTVDLKPDLPGEAARIQQCKGRVFALQDEPEVARVWLPNNDSPGLAMARAFGDFCLKDFGLISVPDVYYRRLTARDQFVILATDGVWDVLSNKEAVDIIASAPSRETAGRALVDTAVRAWRLKYPTSKNDDCAVVCLFLDHEPTTTETEAEENTSVDEISTGEVTATQGVSDGKDGEVDSEFRRTGLERSGTLQGCNEIEAVCESMEEKNEKKGPNQCKRSLAEFISNEEEEEWSALEGISRVNSLLSIPRFLSGDKRSASWRKWL